MATVSAKTKYIRMSPQKVREVAFLVRGKTARQALDILKNVPQRPAGQIAKVIESALANAHSRKITGDNFRLAELRVDEGPVLKRFRAGTQGRAMGIIHRTTHITVSLTNEWDKK